MNKLFTRVSHACVAMFCIIPVLFPKTSAAQISMKRDTTTYTQNFDVLPAVKDSIWENGTSYMDGWFVQRTKQKNTIVVSPGNNIGGNLYSFGSTGSADRALGSQSSLLAGEFAWGLLLQNNTGSTIYSIDISFTGEQWRISEVTAGEHKVAFSYAINSDKAAFMLSPKADDSWIAYPELNFKAPHFYTTGGGRNGNLPENRTHLSAVLAVDIPDGHYLMLRWKDADEPDTDHGLAIDDFSLTWRMEDLERPVVVLPIELAHFTAQNKGTSVALEWLTASEEQNAYFLVERSGNGQTFETIGKADGQGTTVLATNYAYTDDRPLAGTSYYRLKQVDEDGSYTYSALVGVTRGESAFASTVYPTVATDYLQLALASGNSFRFAYVLDMTGRQLLQTPLSENTLQYTLDIRGLHTGTYVLVLLDEQGQRQKLRFLKR